MIRNTEGLRRSARLRRAQAIERAQVALAQLESAGHPINFRTVASHARVSTAWLYGEASLRERIIRLRQSDVGTPHPKTQDTKALSRNNVIAALRMRVKNLEERNRELEARLELAYGQLASGKATGRLA